MVYKNTYPNFHSFTFYSKHSWTYYKTTQNVIHPTTHAINQKKVDMWICRKKSKQKTEISFPYKSVFLMREFCGLNLKEFDPYDYVCHLQNENFEV